MQKLARAAEVVALSEAAGGILGVVTLTRALTSYSHLGSLESIAIMYALCLVAVLGGVGLLKRKRWAVRLTTIILLLQVPLWRAAASVYEVLLGPRLVVGIFDGHPMLYAGFAANLDLRWEPTREHHFMAINLFAAAAAVIIVLARHSTNPNGAGGGAVRSRTGG